MAVSAGKQIAASSISNTSEGNDVINCGGVFDNLENKTLGNDYIKIDPSSTTSDTIIFQQGSGNVIVRFDSMSDQNVGKNDPTISFAGLNESDLEFFYYDVKQKIQLTNTGAAPQFPYGFTYEDKSLGYVEIKSTGEIIDLPLDEYVFQTTSTQLISGQTFTSSNATDIPGDLTFEFADGTKVSGNKILSLFQTEGDGEHLLLGAAAFCVSVPA